MGYNAPLHHFERCGGAVQWGIKTVVALYSRHDREKDQELVGRLMDEFTRLMPSPKWKLVVDLGPKVPPPDLTLEEDSTSHVSTMQESTATSNNGSTTPSEAIDPRVDAVVSLLGEHIPLDPMSPLASYIPGFISFRLILLQTTWSDHERELVTTLLDSYSSYTASGRLRSDIAVLLARDYMFLSQYYSQQSTPQVGIIGENTTLSLTHVNSDNGITSVGSPYNSNAVDSNNGAGGAMIPHNILNNI